MPVNLATRFRLIVFLTLLLAAARPYPLQAAEASPEDIQRARSAIASLGASLKNELQAAMKNGGPQAAVAVCNVQAPQIADAVKASSGLDIRRVSRRARNSGNTPDPSEQAVLQKFERAVKSGAAVSSLNWSQSAEGRFRYMQAIGVESLCLTCHGKQVDADLSAQLKTLYPNDKATGYSEGDLRGAFVVEGPVSP